MLLAESVTPLGAPMQTRLLALLALVFVVAVSAPGSARATTPGANGPLAFELFSPATGFTGQVARISPHGTNRRVLTAPAPGEPPQPEWSPDGRRIAFVRCTGEESSCNVWVMRRNGTSRIAHHNGVSATFHQPGRRTGDGYCLNEISEMAQVRTGRGCF